MPRKDRKTADTGVPVDEQTPEDDAILSSDSKPVRKPKNCETRGSPSVKSTAPSPRASDGPTDRANISTPNPKNYDGLAFDHKTGELLEPIRKKTVVIPAGKDHAKDKALKYGQTYPHKSPVWKSFYALGNTRAKRCLTADRAPITAFLGASTPEIGALTQKTGDVIAGFLLSQEFRKLNAGIT